MKWLTMELMKAHLRIDSFDEDELLVKYAESAESLLLQWLGRTYDDLLDTYGEVPPPVVHASLLLVDNWFKHRSPTTSQHLSDVPYGNIDTLIQPYMIL